MEQGILHRGTGPPDSYTGYYDGTGADNPANLTDNVIFSQSETTYDAASNGTFSTSKHRWYDAQTGRFLSQDPAESDINAYRYVSNSPLNFIDPSGLTQQTPTPSFSGTFANDFENSFTTFADPLDSYLNGSPSFFGGSAAPRANGPYRSSDEVDDINVLISNLPRLSTDGLRNELTNLQVSGKLTETIINDYHGAIKSRNNLIQYNLEEANVLVHRELEF